MKFHKATEKELQAVEAVKAAVKALPPGVYIETCEFDGELQFWKRTPNGIASAVMIGALRAKRKVTL